MAFVPDTASDSMISALWEIALRISKDHAEALQADHTLAARLDADPELQSVHADRLVEKVMATKERHGYVFEQCPVGTDMGWRCFDENKFDGPESDVGYGLTQDEAYRDYLERADEPEEKPKTTAPLLYSGRDEPNDYGKEVKVESHDDE